MPENDGPKGAAGQTAFSERATRALLRAEAGGPVYDGPVYFSYLRERVRAALNPESTAEPVKPEPLKGGTFHFRHFGH